MDLERTPRRSEVNLQGTYLDVKIEMFYFHSTAEIGHALHHIFWHGCMQILSLYDSNRHFLWNSRWPLSNEGNEEVHVVNEGVVVGAGQVFGLVLVCGSGVVVHVDEAIFHARDVAQALLQVLGVEGILAILWR